MTNVKLSPRAGQPPLKTGQVWQMSESNLTVGTVGKLLVHYQLGKPDAIRIPKACSSIKSVEAFLKTNNAILV
jgi:uncharacterized protein YaeQ